MKEFPKRLLLMLRFSCSTAMATLLALLTPLNSMNAATTANKTNKTELATIGGGCFWCTEAFFETFEGVKDVRSGYAGGKTPNPTYEQVCSGRTAHAEVIQIEFEPQTISYEQILEIFWETHDPTTKDRQGPDTGTQYRSIILYHNEQQKKIAEQSMAKAASKFSAPIVTEIVPLTTFYVAEDYHQDYYRKNPNQPYCAYLISPKLKKLQKIKAQLRKPSAK